MLKNANILHVLRLRPAHGSDPKQIRRLLAMNLRRAVVHQLQDGVPSGSAPACILLNIQIPMQEIGVSRIKIALIPLQVVGLLIDFRDEQMRRFEIKPWKARERWVKL